MDQNQARAAIAGMFDAEGFRTQGHALIDLLADQLAQQLAGRGKVLRLEVSGASLEDVFVELMGQ